MKGNWFFTSCDLKDPYAVLRVMKTVRPQRIFHLASQSNVASSWNSPRETLINNITAQLNLFEAVRQEPIEGLRIHVSGSSEEYGLVHEHELPVQETNPLRPLSPYAVSKVTQDTLAFQYHKSYGLHIVRTRSFNHTGPRQSDVFVVSNFARQIVEIEQGLREPVVRVGNLEAQRDFSDIRDVVRAYALALDRCKPGDVYNIGSGKGAEHQAGPGRPSRHEPADHPRGAGPVSRMRPFGHSQAGGRHRQIQKGRPVGNPGFSFDQTLRDLLDYWRGQAGRVRHPPSKRPNGSPVPGRRGKTDEGGVGTPS